VRAISFTPQRSVPIRYSARRHLGEAHWFWAADIERWVADPEQIEVGKPPRPTMYGEVVAWGRSRLDRLVQALASTPDDVPARIWALDESDHTVAFIRRHQVQEAAVHHRKCKSAARDSVPDPIDPEAGPARPRQRPKRPQTPSHRPGRIGRDRNRPSRLRALLFRTTDALAQNNHRPSQAHRLWGKGRAPGKVFTCSYF
jgi:hypothetical protein